jgi:predicted phosphodiesterase
MRYKIDKIAVISDVHGNLPALEAVLSDIKQRGIELIYNLGDVVGKGPASAQTLDACREVCQVIVRGNWDKSIADEADSPIAIWYREQLGDARLAYLRNLPNSYDFCLSGKQVRLYHASAKSEHHRVHPNAAPAELRAMFDNTPFTGFDNPPPDIAVYGDIHGAYMLPVEIGDISKMLLNAGSVGNPLDFPLATYLIFSGVIDSPTPALVSVDFVRLPYDIEAAIEQARQAGLPDLQEYSVELRTSVYRRNQKKAT